MKPSQAARDERGRVNLDELTDRDLDYGVDDRGLARLRRRLTNIINKYTGALLASHALTAWHKPVNTAGSCISFVIGMHATCMK